MLTKLEKNPADVLRLAKEEEVELTDVQLESISGDCEEYHGYGR